MKERLRTIFHRMIYGPVDRRFYSDNAVLLDRYNLSVLRVVCVCPRPRIHVIRTIPCERLSNVRSERKQLEVKAAFKVLIVIEDKPDV